VDTWKPRQLDTARQTVLRAPVPDDVRAVALGLVNFLSGFSQVWQHDGQVYARRENGAIKFPEPKPPAKIIQARDAKIVRAAAKSLRRPAKKPASRRPVKPIRKRK